MTRIDRFFENIKTWAAFWDKKHFPERLDSLVLSKSEEILQKDICKYFDDLLLGDLSILNKRTSKTDIVQFCGTFCDTLNSIYKKDGKKFFLKEAIFDKNAKIVMVVVQYGEFNPEFKPPIGDGTITAQNGMAYLPNNLLSICKADNKLFWCQAAALNHADIFLNDMIEAGY